MPDDEPVETSSPFTSQRGAALIGNSSLTGFAAAAPVASAVSLCNKRISRYALYGAGLAGCLSVHDAAVRICRVNHIHPLPVQLDSLFHSDFTDGIADSIRTEFSDRLDASASACWIHGRQPRHSRSAAVGDVKLPVGNAVLCRIAPLQVSNSSLSLQLAANAPAISSPHQRGNDWQRLGG